MPDIFFSTLNSKKMQNGIQESLDDLDILGIKNIEISSGHFYENDFFSKLQKSVAKGTKILIHNYSPPEKDDFLINLSDMKLVNRKRSVDCIKKRIDLTKKLNADYFSFHGGFCAYDFKIGKDNSRKKVISKKTAQKYFIKSLKEITKYAKEKNIKIGFENHVVEKGNEDFLIPAKANEISEVFNAIKSKNLFLHLDAGHLNVTAQTYSFDKIDFINEFKDKIYAVHISENDGKKDLNIQINKDFWMLPYLGKFKNLKYVILETKSPINKSYVKKISLIINQR